MRIVIEIDGQEVTAATVQPAALAELTARAGATGATDAGPAPTHLTPAAEASGLSSALAPGATDAGQAPEEHGGGK